MELVQRLKAGWCAVASVLALLAVSGCAGVGSNVNFRELSNPPRLHDDDSNATAASQSAAQRQIVSYYDAMLKAENESKTGDGVPPINTPLIQRYSIEGIALVDSYCLRWFQHLEDFERQATSNKQNYNVISQLGTTAIGIAKWSSGVTAAYGALNTAVTGLSDSVTSSFLIAPASKGVKGKVQTVMQQRAVEMRSRLATSNFDDVRHDLENYADLCTYSSAKNLVDASVSAAKPTVTATGEFRIGYDGASAALRKFWKPDGTHIDTGNAAALQDWMRSHGVNDDIASFVYVATYAAQRVEAVQDLQP